MTMQCVLTYEDMSFGKILFLITNDSEASFFASEVSIPKCHLFANRHLFITVFQESRTYDLSLLSQASK